MTRLKLRWGLVQGGSQIGVSVRQVEFCAERFEFIQGLLAKFAVKIFISFAEEDSACGETMRVNCAFIVDLVRTSGGPHRFYFNITLQVNHFRR